MRGSPFFDGVSQIETEMGNEPARLPVFYYDTSAMTALFPARYGALRRLLPDPRFVPARLAPGLGVVVISCLEHRDTDIGAYNEVAIGITLNEPSFGANWPGRAVSQALWRGQFHVFIEHLAVTTEIALRGGIDFYNFPKFVAAIEFDEAGGRRRCRLAEGQEPILTLSGAQLDATGHAEVQYFCHLWMDRQPQRAEFKINQLQVAATIRPGAASLELGRRHPIAQELERLLVSRRPLRYEYVPRLEAILYGPEHLSLPLLQRALAATAAAEQHPTAT